MLCAMAGANYFMGVPGGDDVMLSYMDTSYYDDASVREILGLRPLPEFEQWLEKMGIMENGRLTKLLEIPPFLIGNKGGNNSGNQRKAHCRKWCGDITTC